MNRKVSIIVPIYNADSFLSKCIYSLIEQTYHNIEIILIDNSSNDQSAEICNHFAARDKRIIFLTQPIPGVSSARNRGLEIISGDYLAFLDADDWFEVDAIEKTVALIEAQSADVVFFNSYNEQGDQQTPRATELATGVVGSAELVRQMLCYRDAAGVMHGYYFSVWNKLFRISSLRKTKGGLKPFDPELRILEDGVWLMRHVPELKKGVLCNECLHHRLFHGQSAMGNKELFFDTEQAYLSSYSSILDIVKEIGDPQALEMCKDSYFRRLRKMVMMTYTADPPEEKHLEEFIRAINPTYGPEFIANELFEMQRILRSASYSRGRKITALLQKHLLVRIGFKVLHFFRKLRQIIKNRMVSFKSSLLVANESGFDFEKSMENGESNGNG